MPRLPNRPCQRSSARPSAKGYPTATADGSGPRASRLVPAERGRASTGDNPWNWHRRCDGTGGNSYRSAAIRSGRQFAAWLGLTPLANSSGGKERMGRISKMGDPYLRRLMVVGATSRVCIARRAPERERPLVQLLQRKPTRLATVALANRTARIVWALMVRGGVYRAGGPAASAPA